MINRATDAFIEWCKKNTPGARLQRTIVQGIIGILIAGLATGEWSAGIIVGIVTAILSPIQGCIGNDGEVK